MCKVLVVNKMLGETGEPIGKPSPLGYPFDIDKDEPAEETVEKYRKWFNKKRRYGKAHAELVRLYRKAKTQGHLELCCWCAPKPCHGDVIKEFLERYL